MFKWDVSVQADKVSIYEEHKKIGCSSEFTQTCYWGIKPSSLRGMDKAEDVWILFGSLVVAEKNGMIWEKPVCCCMGAPN